MQDRINHVVINLFLLILLAGSRGYAGTNPDADFSVDNATPVVGQAITFSDNSTNGSNWGGSVDQIVAWSWNFGTAANPANISGQGPHGVYYSLPGTYSVTLEVTTNSGRNDTETKNSFISVSCGTTASITPSGPLSITYGSSISLEANPSGSYGTYDTHEWTGDGSAYLSATNIQNPTFSGAPVGTYNLIYEVTDSYGCIGTDNISITVTKKELTVTAENQTVTYGTLGSVITHNGTYSISGFVYSDNNSVISGLSTISYATTYTETTDAGTSGITITPNIGGLTADNYFFTAVSGEIIINKSDQYIISGVFPFTKPLNEFVDEPVPLDITASSGLPVEITLEAGSAATLNYDGNQSPSYFLTDIGSTGLVTIHINQSGNVNFNPAEEITRIFDVTKSNQSISFPEIDNMNYSSGLTLELTAVASSGLGIIYSVESGPATINGNIVTMTEAGEIWITASQPGNAAYNPASDVTRSFIINKSPQTISINVPAETLTESTQISAASTSGLPVTLALGINSDATGLIDHGTYYTLTGIGSVGSGEIYIVGNQAGNINFLPADQIIQTIDISKTNQTIAFSAISNQTYSTFLTVALSATASSGLTVSFSVVSGPATLGGSVLTITGAGTVIVEASQTGDATYNPAPTITQQFEVYKAAPVIIQSDIVKNLGDADFSISPISESNGSFSFVGGNDEIFTIDGSTATVIGAGTATLDISQEPTSNYFGATKTIVFTVNKASSTISMTGLTEFIYSGTRLGPESSTVTGSTGVVTYTYEGTGSTSYGPDTSKPIDAGTYIVTATVEEDDNYAAATSTPYLFTILKADAIINVTPYSVTYDGASHTAIGVAEGVSDEALTGLDLSGTTHINAGNYNEDTWVFTDVTGNYNDVSGSLDNFIIPKNLTITASDQIKCYGDIFSFAGTEFSSTGLVNLETIGSVTLSSSGSGSGAIEGIYSIIPSDATGGTFNSSNYSITYLNGEFTINPLPILSGALQDATVCPGSFATINLTGLLPDKLFSLDYTINGVPQTTINGLSSDASGNSYFASSALIEDNDGQVLKITEITILSESPNCSQTFSQDVILSVKPNPTLTGASQEIPVCDGSSATINLAGLLPGSTFSLEYSINNINQTPIENLVADGSGNSSFATSVLTGANNGQILRILGILITGESPECSESFNQEVTLSVNLLPEIVTTGVIDEACFSNVSETTTLAYSSSENNPVSYSIDWDSIANSAGLDDQETTVFSFLSEGGTISGIIITENTPNGNYNGTMTVTNGNGCSKTQVVSIKINPLPNTSEINTN